MRADDRVMCPLGGRINEVQAKRVLNTGTKYWPSDYKYWYITPCLQKPTVDIISTLWKASRKPVTSNRFLHVVHSEQTSSQREQTDSSVLSCHSCNNSAQSHTTKYFVQANLPRVSRMIKVSYSVIRCLNTLCLRAPAAFNGLSFIYIHSTCSFKWLW